MPMDSLFYESSDDAFKRRCIGWELKFILWPRQCHYSKKWLWLKNAYLGVSMLTGPGEPIFEYRWCDKNQYLFEKIKGRI